jgi:glucose-6-phosphate 1-dehydrogenase
VAAVLNSVRRLPHPFDWVDVPAERTLLSQYIRSAHHIGQVENERWSGVPFLMKAGKGLDERMAEVRIHFKPKPYNGLMHSAAGNELVLRIQPNEACYFKTFSKLPGCARMLSSKPALLLLRDRLAVV